jgi:predicted metal-dependent hydrolase
MVNAAQKQICLKGQTLNYHLKKSSRARHVRLTVSCEGRLTLILPPRIPFWSAEQFLSQKADWVFRQLKKMEERSKSPFSHVPNQGEYEKMKQPALALAQEKAAYFNARHYGYSYQKITIRNQKTRWGSCSRSGNLNFNYKIIYLPESLRDYLVVHELCHLAEFNHSPRFWKLVARAIPDYAQIRRQLRQL